MLSKLRTVLVATLLVVSLSSCSGPLKLLTGGGPNIAANVPVAVGQEVEQTQGVSVKTEAPSVSIRPNSRTGDIDQSQNQVQADEVKTVVVNEVPVWVILLLILGWLFPSPGEIGRWVRSLFTRSP